MVISFFLSVLCLLLQKQVLARGQLTTNMFAVTMRRGFEHAGGSQEEAIFRATSVAQLGQLGP